MIRSVSWLVAGVVGLSVPAAAQDWKGMGRIEGKVLDAQGNPIADAVVKLDLPSRGGGTTVKTDKKGRWVLGGIAAGTWNADIEAPGYVARKISIPLAGESSRLAPIEVRLEKAAPKGPPPEVEAALAKANEAFQAGRYAEARTEYEKLLALRPELALVVHKHIAYTYSQEKNYEKELEHLQKVLDADPTNTEIRVLMALEAIEGNMLERGLELLKGVDEAQIKNAEVFYNVGAKFRNNNQPEQAVVYFTKAVTADPAYVDGYLQRALTYLGMGKSAEARADFQKVMELQPAGPQAELARKALEQVK